MVTAKGAYGNAEFLSSFLFLTWWTAFEGVLWVPLGLLIQ